MRQLTVAATQMACSWDADDNIARAEALVRAAAGDGARIILLQELFQTPYFCSEIDARHFGLARPLHEDRAGLAHYNALALIDADGEILANYRKTHIPQAAGYEEKYYFTPGDTGFKVVETRHARLGCGICWDQWFPETARSLALMGAEVLMFPTAIGSEPKFPDLDSAAHWQRTMQGHATANIMPLVASNRIGTEVQGDTEMRFYGSSFIAGHTGEILAEADRSTETHITASFDLDEIRDYRTAWGVFRDRRPDMYRAMGTIDGAAAAVG